MGTSIDMQMANLKRRPMISKTPEVTDDEDEEINVEYCDDNEWQQSVESRRTVNKPNQSLSSYQTLHGDTSNCGRLCQTERKEMKRLPESQSSTSKSRLAGERNASSFSRAWMIIFAFVVVSIVSIYIRGWYFSPSEQSISDKFLQNFKQVYEKFPAQRKNSWKKIKTVVKATASFQEPSYPGVITLLALSNAELVASCLGHLLANSLRLAHNDSQYVDLKGKSFRNKDADAAKWEVDSAIQKGFLKGAHVVLFDGLHYLPPQSSLLFHGLCDNENAPFKRAIYIFTVTTQTFSEKETDNEVTSIWHDKLSEDQRSSLETRIGNYIILVNPERTDLPKECA